MGERRWSFVAIACLLALPAAAVAGTLESTGTITLGSNSFSLETWNVIDDLDSIDPNYAVEPEGMTFDPGTGTLWVAGDRDDDETDGHLVGYAAGDLTSPTALKMADRSDDPGKMIGPEGLAVNTSGAGYGGSGSEIVFSETKGTEIAGVVDVAGGPPAPVSNIINTPYEWDGLGYVSSLDYFVAVEEHAGDISKAQYYSHTATSMTAVGSPFVVSDQAKGVTALDGYIASGLLGMNITDDQVLVFAAKPANILNGNRLGFFALDGTLLSEFDIDADLAIGAEIESIAVDETNKILYLGDEETGRIYAISNIPEPTTMALLAVGGLGALVSRRRT